MEHSLLHALQLLGLLVATAGPVLWLVVARGLAVPDEATEWQEASRRISRLAALLAATAVGLDVFVQVAEASGRTVFGGVPLEQVPEFVRTTTVGQLALARIAFLLLAAAAFSLPLRVTWLVASVPCLGALLATALVSHAAAQPQGRAEALTLQVVHLLAVSSWMGVLFQWWLLRDSFLQSSSAAVHAFRARLLRRFSPWALAVTVTLFTSGFLAAFRFVGSVPDLFFSAYGLTLLLKLFLLLPILWAGFVNFRWLVPAITSASEGVAPLLARFRRTLELEVTAGFLVIAVAGIVGSISPPGQDGSVTLTREQIVAVIQPRLPPTQFVDPTLFVGAAERNVYDLLYSEFMHNWSGVFVIVLALCWWVQGLGGRFAPWAHRMWLLLLLPFAGFISYFADPEVFVLRQVSFWEAVSDPVVIEHQVGAWLVLVLVWLGWRDHFRPVAQRPLGPALPLLMVFGSLLLLGHAHSSVRATQELTNLINVQHAVFGALGLVAGWIRWLMLRELLPSRIFRHLWPALVAALGAAMAFFYREAL